MIRRFSRILVALLICWLGVNYLAASPPGIAGFESANKLYEEGKYKQAAAAYADLLQTGPHSAALYFNFGNALFKSGEIGRAIAAYRQAQRLAPRDPDVQANLQFAREQSLGPRYPLAWWQRTLGKFTVNEWTTAVSVAIWAVFLMLALAQWKPALRRPLRGSLVALGTITALLCGCLGVEWHYANSEKTAVVVAPSADVRYGPLDESQSAFTAHDGAELEVVDRKDNWLRVEAGTGRTGWIKQEQVVIL